MIKEYDLIKIRRGYARENGLSLNKIYQVTNVVAGGARAYVENDRLRTILLWDHEYTKVGEAQGKLSRTELQELNKKTVPADVTPQAQVNSAALRIAKLAGDPNQLNGLSENLTALELKVRNLEAKVNDAIKTLSR